MLKLQRPMAVNLRAEAAALGPGEGIRRHRELITALETDDPAVVIEALEKHGSQRYLSPAPGLGHRLDDRLGHRCEHVRPSGLTDLTHS